MPLLSGRCLLCDWYVNEMAHVANPFTHFPYSVFVLLGWYYSVRDSDVPLECVRIPRMHLKLQLLHQSCIQDQTESESGTFFRKKTKYYF